VRRAQWLVARPTPGWRPPGNRLCARIHKRTWCVLSYPLPLVDIPGDTAQGVTAFAEKTHIRHVPGPLG